MIPEQIASLKTTSQIRLLIVEDEAVILQRLQRLYAQVFEEKQIAFQIDCAESLKSASQILKQNNYELVSLDLNLSGNSGFDLLQQACCSAAQTIIVSAYRDQAITAFEYGVLDFVPKPFTRQRLSKAVSRFVEKSVESEGSDMKYLLTKNGNTLMRINLEDIESVEGYGNYSKIHLSNGKEHLHEKGLESLLKILPGHFLRVHKSHILNLNHFQELKSLGGGQYQVNTLTGTAVPVGRSRVDALKLNIQKTISP